MSEQTIVKCNHCNETKRVTANSCLKLEHKCFKCVRSDEYKTDFDMHFDSEDDSESDTDDEYVEERFFRGVIKRNRQTLESVDPKLGTCVRHNCPWSFKKCMYEHRKERCDYDYECDWFNDRDGGGYVSEDEETIHKQERDPMIELVDLCNSDVEMELFVRSPSPLSDADGDMVECVRCKLPGNPNEPCDQCDFIPIKVEESVYDNMLEERPTKKVKFEEDIGDSSTDEEDETLRKVTSSHDICDDETVELVMECKKAGQCKKCARCETWRIRKNEINRNYKARAKQSKPITEPKKRGRKSNKEVFSADQLFKGEKDVEIFKTFGWTYPGINSLGEYTSVEDLRLVRMARHAYASMNNLEIKCVVCKSTYEYGDNCTECDRELNDLAESYDDEDFI